jgi:hypothetical protein
LDSQASGIREADLFDAAHGIWVEYMTGEPVEALPVRVRAERFRERAGVLARCAKYLDSQAMLDCALEAFGAEDFATQMTQAESQVGRVEWWPSAARLVIDWAATPRRPFGYTVVFTPEGSDMVSFDGPYAFATITIPRVPS